MNVRQLTEADAKALHAVRGRALREHPTAFGRSPEEAADLATTSVNLRDGAPDNVSFGGFLEGQLMGIIHFSRPSRRKLRHRAEIAAMYVAPEGRGKGLGAALVQAVIDYARAQEGLEVLTLSVTIDNDPAEGLYHKLGFMPYATDPDYFKIDNQYYDIQWMKLSLKD